MDKVDRSRQVSISGDAPWKIAGSRDVKKLQGYHLDQKALGEETMLAFSLLWYQLIESLPKALGALLLVPTSLQILDNPTSRF